MYITHRLTNLTDPDSLLQSPLLQEMLRIQDSVNLAINTFTSHLKSQLHLKLTQTSKKHNEMKYLYVPFLVLSFLVVWSREFHQLHQKRRQVTSYILLLPGRLIKENQFLKVWLSRSLGIKQSFE